MPTPISGSNRILDIDPTTQALERAVEIFTLPFLIALYVTSDVIYHASVNKKIKCSIAYSFIVNL
jgi:hypothetical protein